VRLALVKLTVTIVPPPFGRVTLCPLAIYHPVGIIAEVGSAIIPLVGIGLSKNVVVMVILELP
jgi:hypothetical protein